MRKLMRPLPYKILGRSKEPVYNPEIVTQQLKTWSTRLNQLASSPSSKLYLGQLTALLNYYNRRVQTIQQEIDWNDWKSRIQTKGLVDKVKQNYQNQSKQEYQLDKIFTDILTRDSKAIDQINNQMQFHYTMWLDNYMDYVIFLTDLNTVTVPTDYTTQQWLDMHPGLQARGQALSQTHCYLPGSRDDVNLHGYMMKQFAYGKRLVSFYFHPTESYKQCRATKSSYGF